MAFRRERGDSLIREELTLAIRDELSDPRLAGLVITEVVLTRDRRFARVFVAHYEGEEALQAALAGLESAKGALRRHLGQALTWRFTPDLGFLPDRAWAYGEHIDALFAQLGQGQGADDAATDRQDDASDE